MKKYSLLLLFFFPVFCIAQKGIEFENDLSWEQMLVKAKNENKYIFMDAFTTWCGPCKYMAANIFTKQAVGDLFNKNYVSVKVQLDTTSKDDERIKKEYVFAHNIMTEYKVNVFPTFLIFDANGKLVHRMVGSSEEPEFIEKANGALNPENQYYLMLEKYRSGNTETAFLLNLLKASQNAFDKENKVKILAEYLNTQKDFRTKENAEMIVESTESTKDASFKILMENAEIFDELLNSTKATSSVVDIIKHDIIFPAFNREIITDLDWKKVYSDVNNNYPKYANEAVVSAKINYFQSKHDRTNYIKAVQDYMKKYGSKVTSAQLNEFSWNFFEYTSNEDVLKNALEWSKKSIEENNNPMYMDTYANLLYKTGNVNEAIEWELKALDLVGEKEKKDYNITLGKMKNGEKTWKE